jgi:hypothetical protein
MSYEYQSFATLGVNLNRQNYGALDISQVFNSKADLDYYLSKGKVTEGVSDYWKKIVPYPYEGQIIATTFGDHNRVYVLYDVGDGTFNNTELALMNEVGNQLSSMENQLANVDSQIQGVVYDVQGHEIDEPGTLTLWGIKNYVDKLAQSLDSLCYIDGGDATRAEIEAANKVYDEALNKYSNASLAGDQAAINEALEQMNSVAAIVNGEKVYYVTSRVLDIDGDGKVNNKDIGVLLKYLNAWDGVTIAEGSGDINGDGKVNNKDLGLLLQYLNGWDVVVLVDENGEEIKE